MVIRARFAVPTALAILAACRTPAPPAAIDPVLSARVPAVTVALAGIDLDRLRTSPLFAKLSHSNIVNVFVLLIDHRACFNRKKIK